MGLFSRAAFFTTVNHLRDLPLHGGLEVAFAGRGFVRREVHSE